ncbi:nose resistant to fluoxetine protein 6-like [Chelonus insularis]|uniref:nose resistant to fluoxetine protein 6-like n=1 Tax=Chelonus insularis TaxID=460826 RepID=UPI00158BDE53|nr:nose resistant to fluoxetine protein 6-like [Chelonus insularis]
MFKLSSVYVKICFITLVIYFIGIINNVKANSNDKIEKSFPAYIITETTDILKNFSKCKSELNMLREGIDNRKLWSLKILDANGKPSSGFIYGNKFWLGQKTQCSDLGNNKPLELIPSFLKNNSLYRNIDEEFPPYEINYFIARFRHNSTIQYHVRMPDEDIITLGLCLPASCTTHELQSILNEIFKTKALPVGDLYAADFSLIHVKDGRFDYHWLLNWQSIIFIMILIIIGLMIILGTGYDIIIYQKRLVKKKRLMNLNDNNDGLYLNPTSFPQHKHLAIKNTCKPSSMLCHILLCFSVYTNSGMIFKTKIKKDSISAIHGIKFLGMLWIILIHTVIYMNDFADNRITAWRNGEGFSAQIISNGAMSVDTFFCISGFLVAWLFFKEKNKKKEEREHAIRLNWTNFFGLIIKRIVRLTPAYMIVLGIIQMFTSFYAHVALFQMSERPEEMCAKYWWRNLLYINNLFDKDTMCLSWSWYISNDMQFFIVGIFLLFLSNIYFYLAVILLFGLLISSVLITGYVSYSNEFIFTADDLWNKMNIIYDPPWVRIGPYLVGMIAAYILFRLEGKLIVKKGTLCLLWILGSSCNLLTLFGTSNRRILTVVTSAFYMALGRTIWGIGIAWLLIACHTNNAGIINNFLSLKAWIPMSRMTYGAYLLNPIIASTMYMMAEKPVHVDITPAFITYLGNVFLTYLFAYILAITLETPFILLQKVLTQPRHRHQ